MAPSPAEKPHDVFLLQAIQHAVTWVLDPISGTINPAFWDKASSGDLKVLPLGSLVLLMCVGQRDV